MEKYILVKKFRLKKGNIHCRNEDCRDLKSERRYNSIKAIQHERNNAQTIFPIYRKFLHK
jgi:hypothetical protein